MSFQQGLSGLNVAAKSLDIVGNNIANVSSVGFKAATGQFKDVYAASLGGVSGGSTATGQGASLAAVAQQFTQGNVTATNNPLDLAINGNGFLRVQSSLTDKTPSYTRNGQLHVDKQGYLVNAQDLYLNVYPATANGQGINSSEGIPLRLGSAPLAPQPTGFTNIDNEGAGGVELGLNLDVRDKRATGLSAPAAPNGWTSLAPWDFANLDATMYNYSTSSTIFDQRGEPHILTAYFVRQAEPADTTMGGSQWQPHFVLDSKYEIQSFKSKDVNNNEVFAFGAFPTGAFGHPLVFDQSGQLDTTTYGSRLEFDLTDASVVDKLGNGVSLVAAPPGLGLFPDATTQPNYKLTIDLGSTTQFGSNYDVSRLTADGYGPGQLSGVSIDDSGMVTAKYSNGKTQLLGQVLMATFQNPNGLNPIGNNLWSPTADSGPALEGTAKSGGRGAIQAGAVEEANVDLTAELVNMITLQRAYQANAQSIKTQDQILQTMVNLR